MQNDLLENAASSAEDVIKNVEANRDDIEPPAADENLDDEEIHLPTDPIEWNADNIKAWISWVTKEFKLEPTPDFNRFPSTGRELIECKRADFWVCAGSKLGGNTLAKHLAHLQYTATGRCTSPLNNDNDPGICVTFCAYCSSISISHWRIYIIQVIISFNRFPHPPLNLD